MEVWLPEIIHTITYNVLEHIPFYASLPTNDVIASFNTAGHIMFDSLAQSDMQNFQAHVLEQLKQRLHQGLTLDQAMLIPSLVRQTMLRVSFMALKEQIHGSEDGILLIGQVCDCITAAIAQSYHTHLEMVVTDRTRELTCTNEHLYHEILECERLHKELQHQADNLRIFQALTEYAPDGIIITSFGNMITAANPAFRTMSGYGDAVIGMHIYDFYAEEQNVLLFATQQAIASGFWQGELTCRRKDGSTFAGHVSLFTVRGSDEEPLVLACIIRDITEHKQTQAEIRALNAELEKRVNERTTQLVGEIIEHKRTEAALRESERRYRIVSELTSDYIYSMRIASNGSFKMEWFTESFIRSLGYEVDEFHEPDEQWIQRLIYHEDIPTFKRHVACVIDGHIDVCEFRVRSSDGSIRWLRSYAQPDYNNTRQPVRVFGAQQDITMYKQEEEALRASEARYRAIVEDQTELICRFLADGTLTFVNDAYCRYFNMPREKLIGWNFLSVILNDEHELVRQRFESLSPMNPIVTYEHRVMSSSGKIRWQQWTDRAIFDEHGRFIEFQAIGRDITDQKWAEEQLRYHTLHDALTRLPNRILFLDRLGQAIKRRKNQIAPCFAVLLVDLDNFKMISSSLGHLAADEMLKKIAHRLQTCLNSSDTVARCGDDEFGVLLENTNDIGEATSIADRIRHALSRPLNLGDHEIVTSASIGITMSAAHYHKPETMLRDADLAMHHAKMQGRDCYVVFDTTMHTHAVERLQRETDLRRAIERQELLLVYQPIVEIPSGRIAGFEALVRWHHPQRGIVSPVEFIPIAEETGLVIPLGHWVLRQACLQIRTWNMHFSALSPLHVHVNLSPKEFAQPHLKQQVAAILEETNVIPACLNLEITESVMMSDAEATITTLKSLRELGIQLSVDDFGTGYSSLRYMQRFPAQVVKIDRSFISAIVNDASSTAIVEAIVMLSHAMGMKVVAEGVSSLEDLAQLESMGCDYGQGFLFSTPLNEDMATIWLAEVIANLEQVGNRDMHTRLLKTAWNISCRSSDGCDSR